MAQADHPEPGMATVSVDELESLRRKAGKADQLALEVTKLRQLLATKEKRLTEAKAALKRANPLCPLDLAASPFGSAGTGGGGTAGTDNAAEAKIMPQLTTTWTKADAAACVSYGQAADACTGLCSNADRAVLVTPAGCADGALAAESPALSGNQSACTAASPSSCLQDSQLPPPERPAADGAAEASSSTASSERLPVFSGYQLHVCQHAVEGWVEQYSPSCGAASLAGAWNAIRPAGKARLELTGGLQLYRERFACDVAAAQAALRDCLAVPDASLLERKLLDLWPITEETQKPTKATAKRLLRKAMLAYACPAPATAVEPTTACSSGLQQPDQLVCSPTVLPLSGGAQGSNREGSDCGCSVCDSDEGGSQAGSLELLNTSQQQSAACSDANSDPVDPSSTSAPHTAALIHISAGPTPNAAHMTLQQAATARLGRHRPTPAVRRSKDTIPLPIDSLLQIRGADSPRAACTRAAAGAVTGATPADEGATGLAATGTYTGPEAAGSILPVAFGGVPRPAASQTICAAGKGSPATYTNGENASPPAQPTQRPATCGSSGSGRISGDLPSQAGEPSRPQEGSGLSGDLPSQAAEISRPQEGSGLSGDLPSQVAEISRPQEGSGLSGDLPSQAAETSRPQEGSGLSGDLPSQAAEPSRPQEGSGLSVDLPSQAAEPSRPQEGQPAPEAALWAAVEQTLAGKKPADKLAAAVSHLLTKRLALWKLSKAKPSTAPIGNLHLMAALRALGERESVDLAIWKVLAAGKNRCELHVRPSDGPEDVAEQWQRLMAVLERPDTVLLFHLENHYCLVFAAREWRMNVGYSGKRVVRQLLVAKPGQRPGSWMDFETVRSTVLGWAGYGIIGISRREDVVLP